MNFVGCLTKVPAWHSDFPYSVFHNFCHSVASGTWCGEFGGNVITNIKQKNPE